MFVSKTKFRFLESWERNSESTDSCRRPFSLKWYERQTAEIVSVLFSRPLSTVWFPVCQATSGKGVVAGVEVSPLTHHLHRQAT